jgi:uncharacterized SAM-binding protein YcdF (DUF218 family)
LKLRWKFFGGMRIRRVLALGIAVWLWGMFVLAIIIDAYGRIDRVQKADVIIVLGAGVQRDNTPGTAMRRRASHAADLWKAGYAPRIICSGGKPGYQTRAESDACAELLIREDGIPESAVIQEDQSRSTEENAIYTHRIMQANGWQTAIVVSDGFHLFRARHLFLSEGMTIYTSPTSDDQSDGQYLVYLLREVAAIQWQVVKEVLNLPTTYVQGI